MGVLADVCLAAGANAGDSEQGLALAPYDTISFLGAACWEGDQCQTDSASLGKADPTRGPEYAVLVDGVDDLGQELGHKRFLLLEYSDNLPGITRRVKHQLWRYAPRCPRSPLLSPLLHVPASPVLRFPVSPFLPCTPAPLHLASRLS